VYQTGIFRATFEWRGRQTDFRPRLVVAFKQVSDTDAMLMGDLDGTLDVDTAQIGGMLGYHGKLNGGALLFGI